MDSDCAILSSVVDGFTWVEGTQEWRVEGTPGAKVRLWHEEDRLEREAYEWRHLERRWNDDSMDVDDEDEDADESNHSITHPAPNMYVSSPFSFVSPTN
jgi:hypothetical protein